MRTLEASANPAARRAIAYFVERVRQQIGALAAAIGGIGEHAAGVRAEIVQGLAWLGLTLDPAANARDAELATRTDSRVAAYVIATDEERMIAEHTAQCARGRAAPIPPS